MAFLMIGILLTLSVPEISKNSIFEISVEILLNTLLKSSCKDSACYCYPKVVRRYDLYSRLQGRKRVNFQ